MLLAVIYGNFSFLDSCHFSSASFLLFVFSPLRSVVPLMGLFVVRFVGSFFVVMTGLVCPLAMPVFGFCISACSGLRPDPRQISHFFL